MHLRRVQYLQETLLKLTRLAATAPNKVVVPEDARSSQHQA